MCIVMKTFHIKYISTLVFLISCSIILIIIIETINDTILLSYLDRWRCWYIGSWFSLTTQLYCIGSYHLSPLSLVNFSQRELFRSVSLQPSVLLHLVTMSSVESQQVSGTGDVGRGLISTRKCLDSAQSPGYQESQLEPRGKISVKSSCILTNNMIIL